MNKKGFATKAACILLVMMLSCVFMTACGNSNSHTLSGSYAGKDGSLEFLPNDVCRAYNPSKSMYAEGTYYWDKEDKCYYIEIPNAYNDTSHYHAEIKDNELIITISGHEFIYTKE